MNNNEVINNLWSRYVYKYLSNSINIFIHYTPLSLKIIKLESISKEAVGILHKNKQHY